MVNPEKTSITRMELANRLFFKLYQCANMLHKTGTRAVEDEGLTTQQWAVLGALSRPETAKGMSVGELAKYLMVSRQNLSGLLSRMERDGHIAMKADTLDRRSKLVSMTAIGRRVWQNDATQNFELLRKRSRRLFGQRLVTHAALLAQTLRQHERD